MRKCEHTHSIARAARRANATTATARLLAMLCILSVFIPTFILNEPVRSLFMPLTLAVGFSMIASYLLSSTLVPVLTVWLVRHRRQGRARGRAFRSLSGRASSRSWRPRCGTAGAWWWPTWPPAGAVLAGRQASGHGVVSRSRFGPVRAAFSRPAGLRIRTDAKMRRQDPGRHRRGEPRQPGHVDRLRRPGLHQHGHEQHPAVHAGQRRRRAPRAVEGA